MLTLLEGYARAILLAIVLAVIGAVLTVTYNKGHAGGVAEEKVNTVAAQARFDEYKESMEGQVLKAQAFADAVKRGQDAKYEKAKSDYRRDTSILAARLRDYEGVLCGEGQAPLRLDERGTSGLPAEGASAAGTLKAATSAARTGPVFKYTDAVEDLLQCSSLIKAVNAIQ